MGRKQSWVSQRLVFGRFLSFIATGNSHKDSLIRLTERSFRKLGSRRRVADRQCPSDCEGTGISLRRSAVGSQLPARCWEAPTLLARRGVMDDPPRLAFWRSWRSWRFDGGYRGLKAKDFWEPFFSKNLVLFRLPSPSKRQERQERQNARNPGRNGELSGSSNDMMSLQSLGVSGKSSERWQGSRRRVADRQCPSDCEGTGISLWRTARGTQLPAPDGRLTR
jgi:hypothetical protein